MAMRRIHMEPFALLVRAQQSREIYYRSWDHPNAHELTNRIRHPSPEPGLRSPGAPAPGRKDGGLVREVQDNSLE